MKTKLLASFLLGITILSLSSAEVLNVALHKPGKVAYVGPVPLTTGPIPNTTIPDTAKMNPAMLVDGSYYTYVSFPPGNIGSYVVLDLLDTLDVQQIKIANLTGTSAGHSTRLRGYELSYSSDDSTWTVARSDTAGLDSIGTISLPSSIRARFWRLEITRESSLNFTVISEIMVEADLSGPIVTAVSVRDDSIPGFKTIEWQTRNAAASDKMNIYFKSSSDTSFKTVSLGEPVNGSYLWDARHVPDGECTVKVWPVSTSPGMGAYAECQLQHVKNFKLSCPRQNGFEDPALQWPTTPPPHHFSSIFSDTITLRWDYELTVALDYAIDLYYSLDSARTWQMIASVSDTAIHQYKWRLPPDVGSGFYTFFRASLCENGFEYARSLTEIPVVLSDPPPGVTLKWVLDGETRPAALDDGMPSLLAFQRGDTSTAELLGLGWQWIVEGNGASLDGWNWPGLGAGYAAGDVDGDGRTQYVGCFSSGVSCQPLDRDSGGWGIKMPAGGSPQIVDLDENGQSEILVSSGGTSVCILSHDGTIRDQLLFPVGAYTRGEACVADIDGDGSKDIVVAAGNQIIGTTSKGVVLPGFPLTLADQLLPWIFVARMDSTNGPSIVAAGTHHLYVVSPDGSLRSGFPIYVQEAVQGALPALCDLDNNGELDIVFVAHQPDNGAIRGRSLIYAVDGHGNNLAGWPVAISDSYNYRALDWINTGIIDPITGQIVWTYGPRVVAIQGESASLLVASIDGDDRLEVVATNANGFLYVLNSDGTMKEGYPWYIGTEGCETGVLGDFDGDGSLNFVIRSYPSDYTQSKVLCLDFGPGTYNRNRIPWPMERQNAARTALPPPPVPSGVATGIVQAPSTFALAQNFPNPFNPNTRICFDLPSKSHVTLVVYDLLGREVRRLVEEVREAGKYQVDLNGSNLSSGMYLCRMVAGRFVASRKMLLLK